MRPDADLIRVVFASGPAELNRELIDKAAAAEPDRPLYVVGEFEPHRGEWIPYHPLRAYRENLAAARAALAGKRIDSAAMILSPAVPMAKMRLIARRIARRNLVAYDESLRAVRGAGLARYRARRFVAQASSQRTKQWLRRLAHPSEAEIPLRARGAQIYGMIANRLRGAEMQISMNGAGSLPHGVSVIVPSRDGRELLAAMLPHLVRQIAAGNANPGEIIVSDNGSTDGTAEWLAAHYPEIRVVHSAAPLSFARAVNAGIRAGRFERILLLNNDMIVAPGFVNELNRAFDRIPGLFCATARIFFPPGVRCEETGKAVWRRQFSVDFPVRCDEPVPGEDLTWVLYGSGGCSLFAAAKLRALGGVSEVFDPAYVEDLDLGFRAWKLGWPSVFCAAAQVEHRHRATTARYYTPRELDTIVEINYLRFLAHAIGSPRLFPRLWLEAIRRLQLNAIAGNGAALEALRHIPRIGPRPPQPGGALSESEILALGNGDAAIFPGRLARNRKLVVTVSAYVPFPLAHGGAVRIFNLMHHSDFDHVLIAFADDLATPPEELLAICREVILVRRRGSHYRRDTALPDAIEEFNSETFRACLKQTVRRWKPDIVRLEFTQMAQYADACRPARTVLVEHDITFDLHEQLLAAATETGVARWERERQLRKWKKFEIAAWKTVDCVVTMSAKDQAAVSGAKHVACLPNGVDTDLYQPAAVEPEPRRLLFIGSFAHLPNLLALDFFLRDVWPLLGTGFTLHIIAGSRPDYFLDFHRACVTVDLSLPGIEVEGFVTDVRPAYRRAALVLAPLTASAGTNIKVLEAMAMGRAVISTPAGINGLNLAPGRDVIVAESATEMANRILSLSSDAGARKEIERNARKAALDYDWREISRAQTELYEKLVSSRV